MPGAELRSMLNKPAPGPCTPSDLLMSNSELVKVIVPVTAKIIVSPLAELTITCRSDPAPLSAVEVTVFVAQNPDNGIRANTKSAQQTTFLINQKSEPDAECRDIIP